MSADIHIQDVVNIYYSHTDTWRRDFFAARIHDGVVLFTEGEIEYTFADKKLLAKKGDLLFLPGNIPYSGKKHTRTVAFYVIDFTCMQSDEFERNIRATVCPAGNYEFFLAGFSELLEAWKKQNIDLNFKVKAFLYSVLPYALQTENSPKQPTATDKILDHIREHLSDPALTVAALCDRFYISESQLRRNILRQTGLKPNEYILNLRINMAKNELTYTAKSIREIAAGCGFSSPYYFSKCFSRHTGMTPSKYRLLTAI